MLVFYSNTRLDQIKLAFLHVHSSDVCMDWYFDFLVLGHDCSL